MSGYQFTPGPWRVSADDPGLVETTIGSLFIADCNTASEADFANASLIAAAPDMLAALVRCEAFLAGFWVACADKQEGVSRPLLSDVRAALSRVSA